MKIRFDDFNDPAIGVGYAVYSNPDFEIDPVHTHDYFEIFIVCEGNISHEIFDETVDLFQGDAVFIRPNDRHRYKRKNDGEIINIAFTKEITKSICALLSVERDNQIFTDRLPSILHMSEIFLNRVCRRVHQLSELETNSEAWMIAVRMLVCELIAKFVTNGDNPHLPSWLARCLSEMKRVENFKEGCARIYEICERTPEHLTRSMKRYLGITPSDYINSLRINYVKNQLIYTDYSIIDICYSAGYNNLNYLYKVFKALEGTSPRKYRNENRTLSL